MSSSTEAAATLSQFYRETWFTVEGARLKYRRLRRRGIPDLRNWRFITLTCEDHSGTPLAVYQRGKDKLRRFLAKWRECLGREIRWLWKLELHEDGFPHWHLLIDYTEKVPREFLEEVSSWWGLGRVNMARVKARDMYYVFKYVTKGGASIPDWIADYKGTIRVLQTSSGFFTKDKPRSTEKKEQLTCRVRHTLRTLFRWDESKGILCETCDDGEKRFSVVRLTTTFRALLMSRVRFALRHRVSLPDAQTLHLGQFTVAQIKYEHRKSRGFARIYVDQSTACYHGEFTTGSGPDASRHGDLAA